jgi:hypothetical protein
MFLYGDFMFRTELVLKRYIFWDIVSCNPLKVNRRFDETCSFLLQGRKMSHARNKDGRFVDFQRTTRLYILEDTISL